MSRANYAVQVTRAADGTITNVKPVDAPVLYLDTSDLSYLVLGRLGASDRPLHWRTHLIELRSADKVRLRLSFIHLAEMALRPELSAGLALLETVPNVFFATTSSQEIFAAEAKREGNGVVITERKPDADELRHMKVTLHGSREVSGQDAARWLKKIIGMQARAKSWSKAAARRSQSAPKDKVKRSKRWTAAEAEAASRLF